MSGEVPEFDQFVEYVTEGPVVHSVELQQHSLDSLLTLQVVSGGYVHAVALGRSTSLDAPALTALQTEISSVYSADVSEHEVVSSDPAVIVDHLIAVRSRPEWHVGLACVAADLDRTIGVYFCDGNLYCCLQPHKAQADWRPDLPGLEALWIRFYEPEAGPQEWVQPYGGSGTYVSGSIVTHNGQTWRNIVPAPTLNVWEPGVYGWEVVV